MVVSRCINGLGRVEYLLLFSAVLNSFELLMMTEKFCKNLVKLSDWAVKYRMTVQTSRVIHHFVYGEEGVRMGKNEMYSELFLG